MCQQTNAMHIRMAFGLLAHRIDLLYTFVPLTNVLCLVAKARKERNAENAKTVKKATSTLRKFGQASAKIAPMAVVAAVPKPAAALTKADEGKSIEVVGDSVEVDGVPRGVVWGGARHADVSGVLASVEAGFMGVVVLQGGGELQNPKSGPTIAKPAAPLKAWSKVKGVPAALIPVKEPTPLTLRVFNVKAFDVIDSDAGKGSGIADPYVRFSHPPSAVSSRTEARRNQANPVRAQPLSRL